MSPNVIALIKRKRKYSLLL